MDVADQPSGISMVAACSGTRNCSTNSTLSSASRDDDRARPLAWVRSTYSRCRARPCAGSAFVDDLGFASLVLHADMLMGWVTFCRSGPCPRCSGLNAKSIGGRARSTWWCRPPAAACNRRRVSGPKRNDWTKLSIPASMPHGRNPVPRHRLAHPAQSWPVAATAAHVRVFAQAHGHLRGAAQAQEGDFVDPREQCVRLPKCASRIAAELHRSRSPGMLSTASRSAPVVGDLGRLTPWPP